MSLSSKANSNTKTRYVRSMFGRIAQRYDLLNRLVSLGQDLQWRKETVQRLQLSSGEHILDAGAGTGDLALEILRQSPTARVVAADLTPEMVAIGKQRTNGKAVHWVIADAQHLPFAAGVFQGVVSGYLMRNVPDVDLTLQEQQRVLSPGGGVAVLDTTPPRDNLLKPFIQLYLSVIVPTLGKLVSGDTEAYTYLPQSTKQFLTAEQLAQRIQSAGFEGVQFVRRMFGTMGIHWGRKPSSENLS